MQIGYACVPMALALASACSDQELSYNSTAVACGIDQSTWHVGNISPPNRVLVWHVIVRPAGLEINGEIFDESSALTAIGRTRSLRPSPYLILSSDGSASCERIRALTGRINQAFNCQVNYCFHS